MTMTRRNFNRLSALLAAGIASGAPSWALGQEIIDKLSRPAGTAPDAIYALVNYCLTTRYEALPKNVIEVTKGQILDTIVVMLPALEAEGIAPLYAWSKAAGGHEESLVLGTSVRFPAENAVRINAAMAAALEYDDTYEPALLHASCVTIPVALAAAELAGGVSGKELITAVAVGTDLACRLASAGSPGVSPFIVGWDPTPMYGFLAAAMVAGRILKLDQAQMIAAAGLAYHQLSGNAQASIDGSLAKRLGAGFAASGGLLSARLAQQGVSGPSHVLEGAKGLFNQYHKGKFSKDALSGGLGTRFAGPRIAPKPYPSCRGSHVAIDGMLALVNEYNILPDDVQKVVVYSPPAEIMLLGHPLEKKQNPQTIVEAQFSNPWIVAAAIQDRDIGLRHFSEEALKRQDLRALARRVEIKEDNRLVRPDGGPGFVRLELHTRDGKVHTRTVKYAKGDPENPMAKADVNKKVYECTDAAGMPREQAERIHNRILNLENEVDVAKLTAALAI